jgi:uncharacterized membrane protein YhaH (DUF805 family)
MHFIESTKNYFLKWNDFSTRISRSEFWWGHLGVTITSIIVIFALGFLSDLVGFFSGLVLLVPFQIFVLIASTALAVRRLHEINKSGWWLLIYLTIVGILLLFYWACSKGDADENVFGPDPLDGSLGS